MVWESKPLLCHRTFTPHVWWLVGLFSSINCCLISCTYAAVMPVVYYLNRRWNLRSPMRATTQPTMSTRCLR
ncbi:hypothetical protein EJ04DRAFT_197115 [Polyplosphaeria fusca]|uniref:Uncharacterized protein n=1 Tax=Polyplosphaeria fusca TaxID=682080 RepID=A0A9P4RC69_9PLEO|nr:hypothetical protein EJ04DRAFT_197115 [Polyplosphaeria fusca]